MNPDVWDDSAESLPAFLPVGTRAQPVGFLTAALCHLAHDAGRYRFPHAEVWGLTPHREQGGAGQAGVQDRLFHAL